MIYSLFIASHEKACDKQQCQTLSEKFLMLGQVFHFRQVSLLVGWVDLVDWIGAHYRVGLLH